MPYRPWIHRNTSSMLYRNKYEYIVYVFHSGPKCENYLLTEVVVVWIWQLPSIFLMMNIIFTYVSYNFYVVNQYTENKKNFGHNVVVKYGDK